MTAATERPEIFEDAENAYMNACKTAIKSLHLVKDYLKSDSFLTKTGAKSVANIAIAQEDISIVDNNGAKELVIAAKAGLTKTGTIKKHYVGQATAGSKNSLTVNGATWPDYSRMIVLITAGTNQGETANVIGNTADTLNFDANAFSNDVDGTTEFVVMDDITAIFVSDTKVVHSTAVKPDSEIIVTNPDSTPNTTPVSSGELRISLLDPQRA